MISAIVFCNKPLHTSACCSATHCVTSLCARVVTAARPLPNAHIPGAWYLARWIPHGAEGVSLTRRDPSFAVSVTQCTLRNRRHSSHKTSTGASFQASQNCAGFDALAKHSEEINVIQLGSLVEHAQKSTFTHGLGINIAHTPTDPRPQCFARTKSIPGPGLGDEGNLIKTISS